MNFMTELLMFMNIYKKGGIISGPYYPQQILEEFIKTFLFYTYNYIVKDEFLEFKRVFEKGIKALLICYSIDKRYASRITEFDSWVIRFILFYADTDEIEKTLKRYSIKEINIQDKEINVLIGYFNNLLESIFSETTFLRREVKLDNEILIQSTNFFFQEKLRTTIHNAFLIYSIIPISESYGRPLIKNFLNFLRVETFVFSDNCFNGFLNNIIKYFSFDEILELLKISLSKNFLIGSRQFFEIISNTIKNYHKEKCIEDNDLIDSLIESSINIKENKHQRDFMHLWEVSSERNKKAISEAISADLSIRFYSLDYFIACALNVIDPSMFYSNILKEIEGTLSKQFSLDGDRSTESNLTLMNFLYMLYNRGLLRSEVHYSKFEELPDYAKFYFRPFDFDYSRFDVNWLLPLKSKTFFDHLKLIPEIKKAIEESLRGNYHEKLNEIYGR